MSIFSLVVSTDDNAAQVSNLLAPTVAVDGSDVPANIRNMGSYFHSASEGSKNVAITYSDTLVAATATITVSSTGPTDGETMTVANQTLTAKTSGADPTAGEFDISATPATVATNIAAAINAVAALAGTVTASASLGVVTVTSVLPGNIGNGLEIDNVDLANTVVTAFSGGSEAHRSVVHSGK